MTGSGAKARILELTEAAGINGVGFTDAAPLEETLCHIREALDAGYIPAGSRPGEKTLKKLVAPAARLKSAKTVISAYLCYHTGESLSDDPGLGTIAPYTRADYYGELKSRLETVASSIEKEFGASSKVSSNYVFLAEKPLAARAGLGFYGKNGVIITPRHGSYVVLGEIVTDLILEPDLPLEMDCGKCTACLEACPTGALVAPGWVDRRLCIQYLGERRGDIPHHIRRVWGNRLYGCSTCQDVCPFNRDVPAQAPKGPRAHVGGAIPLVKALPMSEREFVGMFEGNQIGMRERNVIRRNAILAAGNSGMGGFLKPLEVCLNDLDPMIRGHAIWAVAMLGGPEVRATLEKARDAEWEPHVREEAKSALDGWA